MERLRWPQAGMYRERRRIIALYRRAGIAHDYASAIRILKEAYRKYGKEANALQNV